MFLAIAVSLVVGALATSTAEYLKNYNLIDLLKDKIVALYQKLTGKAKAAVVAEVKQADQAVIGRLKKL